MNRKLILYVKAFSDFGTFMDMLVLNVVIYTATGSTGWLAATMAARTIGGVFSSVFSGVMADRFNRRMIMIVSDILRAVIIIALIFMPNPMMILVASFFIGFVNSSFMVSFSAEIPQIFGESKVLETNAVIARLTSISLVAGFLAAGLLTDMLGFELTLLIDAMSYILSAAVLMKIKWDSTSTKKVEVAASFVKKVQSIWLDVKEVHTYLRLAPMIMLVNIVFLAGAFAGSSHNLGIPLLAESLNPDRQSFFYGLIWGVWGIGSVAATYTLPKLEWLKGKNVYYTCFVAAMLMSAGFIIFLSNIYVPIILMFAFFTGIFDACFTTLHATILQRTDNHIRGRIFGVGMLLKSLGFAIGFVIAPILLKQMPMPKMVWVLHGSLIIITLIVLTAAIVMYSKEKNKIKVQNEII